MIRHVETWSPSGLWARWPRAAVCLASGITLYVEMLMVRWHATCFHAFAIFRNVSLLSCFLGLGVGYGLAARRRPVALASFLPLLAVQVLLFGLLSMTNLGGRRINPVAEQLVMGTAASAWDWLDAVEGNVFLAAVFLLNATMFLPLGSLAGSCMERLPKVQSYSLNLLGSLGGIAVFSLLSFMWTPPSVWIGIAVAATAPFLSARRQTTVSLIAAAVILIGLGLVGPQAERRYYSPYQVISLRLPDATSALPSMTIKVNHAFYQEIIDASPAATARSERSAQAATYYELPYRFGRPPGSVLVAGAGVGNDVAAALRHGAPTVTAVEIDPVILDLGKRLHPERPYQDPRTLSVLDDARTFLRRTHERYDTIVYGLLDSHTNLGAMTNVRLDSFVYTVEGFRDAARRLNPDGLIVVSYAILDSHQGDKLHAMLALAWPAPPPRVFEAQYGGTVFMAGPGLEAVPSHVPSAVEVSDRFRSGPTAEVATDDWPFFYMQRRTYPVTYALMVGILVTLSGWFVIRHLGVRRPSASPDGVFFFLGAGFMLIETKAMTELGLVFGNTWSVVAVALSAVLFMGFMANHWVQRRGPVPNGPCFAGLGAALGASWVVTRAAVAGLPIPAESIVLPVVLTLPVFCGGLVFSSELARQGTVGAALSANLLGAMLGGFLEYNSMYWGFSALYPIGALLYGFAFLCARQEPRTVPDAPMPAGAKKLRQAQPERLEM